MKTRFTADRLESMTRQELYTLAREFDIQGRATLSKTALIAALTPFAAVPDKSEVKRGRPAKAAKAEVVEDKPKRGRPAKAAKTEVVEEKPKRGRPAKAAKAEVVEEKPKRGRPAKAAKAEVVEEKPKRGRPAKADHRSAPEKTARTSAETREIEDKAAIEKALPVRSGPKTPSDRKTRLAKVSEAGSNDVKVPARAKESSAARFNKECEEEAAALKRLNRAFGKKDETEPPARKRSKKGAEVIEQGIAIPVEFALGGEDKKTSTKAEQIEKERRRKHASLKTTMEIPVFSGGSYDSTDPVREEDLTGDLPEDYGETRIVIQIRDPHWAHTYWELPLIERKRLELEVGIFEFAHSHYVLRLHNVSRGYSQEIKLTENARSWYLYLEEAQTVYQVELGLQSPVEGYTFIALSNLVQTPPDQVAGRWAEPVAQDPVVETPAQENTPQPEFIPAPEIARLTDPAHVYFTSVAGEPLLHAGSSDLLAGQSLPVPEMPASPRPLELTNVSSFDRPGSFQAQMPSSFAPVPSSNVTSDSVSSFSAHPAGPEGLFFTMSADLILYGTAGGGCSLSLCGQPVKLRPDGSYSLRLALPANSEQQIQLTADDPETRERRTFTARISFNKN